MIGRVARRVSSCFDFESARWSVEADELPRSSLRRCRQNDGRCRQDGGWGYDVLKLDKVNVYTA